MCNMKLLCICFVFVFGVTFVRCDTGCIYPLNKLPKHEPLMFKETRSKNYTLVYPVNGTIRVNSSQEILFQCQGRNNNFIKGKTQEAIGICGPNNRFKILGGNYNISQFNCTKTIMGIIKETKIRCGNNNGILIEIGYPVGSKSWNPLIKVCYDKIRGESFYSEHILYGRDIKSAQIENRRPDFNAEALNPNIHARLLYHKEVEKATFNKILRSSTLSEKYISGNSFLARGHYSPDGDFLLSAWQSTTYYYINTAPQWQAFNAGSWKSLENMVRNAADAYKQDFRIITGSFDILTIRDINGQDKKIYLAPDELLPVPKYWWKVMYNPVTKEGISFLGLNNPFVNNTNDMEICDNICCSSDWTHKSFKIPAKGLIRCCDWNQLSKVIRRVPLLHIQKILKYKELK